MVGREFVTGGGMGRRSDAEFQEHVKTWRAFTRLTIAAVAGMAVILAGLAIAFL